MSFYNDLNKGIFDKITAGTALIASLGGSAVYYNQAPDGQSLPYVVFSYQGGGNDNITPRRSKDNVMYIRAYAVTPAAAGTIDGHLDDLLHNQTLTVAGWTNYWMARETDLTLPDNQESSETVHSAGAFYRVRLSK